MMRGMSRNTVGGRGVTRTVRHWAAWVLLAWLVAGALQPGAARGSTSVASSPTATLQTAADNQNALYTLDGFGGVHPVGAAPSAPGSAYWPGWDIARGIVNRAGHQDGYVLDGFGGVHPFGAAPPLTATAYWRGWDIARGIALTPAGSGGWVLDGWGGLHAFGNAPTVTPSAYWQGWDIARGVVSDLSGTGGWVLDGFGGLHPFGDAAQLSGGGYWPGWDIARGLALTATGTGGYVLDGWGGVHAFGDAAPVTGSAYWRGWDIARAVVAWTAAPSARPGGWVVDGWGAIHPFGSAPAEVSAAAWPGWDIVRGLGGGDNGGSRSYPSPPPPGPCGRTPTPPARYQHVIVLFMENESLGNVLGNSAAPYENRLMHGCGYAASWQDAGVAYDSEPNYVAWATGLSNPAVLNPYICDCSPPPNASATTCVDGQTNCTIDDNLFRQVLASGQTWRSYQESASSNCEETGSGSNGLYATKHNPAAFMFGGTDHQACGLYDIGTGSSYLYQPGDPFANDLAANTLPNLVELTPNLCNDGHDTCGGGLSAVGWGDQYLSRLIPLIVASQEYAAGGTALVVMWDENTPVPNIVVAPSVTPGTVAPSASHYGALRAVEEMLGLPLLGAATTAAGQDLRTNFHV